MAVLHRPAIVLVLAVFSNLASASTDELGACSSSEQGHLETCHSQAKGNGGLSLLQARSSYLKSSERVIDMENEEEGGREEGEQQGKDHEEEATDMEDEVEGGDAGDASGLTRAAGRRRQDFVTKDEFNKGVSKIKQEVKKEVMKIKSEVEDLEKKVEGGTKPQPDTKPAEDVPAKEPATTTVPPEKPAPASKCPLKKPLTEKDLVSTPLQAIKFYFKVCESMFPPGYKMPIEMPTDYKPEPITTETWFFGRPKVVGSTYKDRKTGKQVPFKKRAKEDYQCDSSCNSMQPGVRWYLNSSCECYKGPSLTEPCEGKAPGANCTFKVGFPKDVKGTRLNKNRGYTYFSICVQQSDASKPLWCPPHSKGPTLPAIKPLKEIPCGDNYCKKNKIHGEPCAHCMGSSGSSYEGYTMTLSKCGDVPRRSGGSYFGCLKGTPDSPYKYGTAGGFASPPATAFETGVKGYPRTR